ncbi:MAG: hypothetical protein U0359_11485 [Byssovorax sp.]
MAEQDDDDAETMVANRQMLAGLEATVRGSSPPAQPMPYAAPHRPPDFPAGLVKTMPMAPQAQQVLSTPPPGEIVAADDQGTPQLVINFLLICGVITAFGLMTLIYLNI